MTARHAARPLGRRVFALARGHALSRGAQDSLDRGAPRASSVASRLAGLPVAPPWRTSSSSDRKLARHRGALLAGLKPRRLLPLVIPGCRSARGRRARHAPCSPAQRREGCRRTARAGVRHFRSPEPKGRSDNPRGVIRSGALWPAGTRAHAPWRSRDMRGSAALLEGARSGRKPYVPLHPGIVASGSAAARLTGRPRTKRLALASHFAHDGSEARARPTPR